MHTTRGWLAVFQGIADMQPGDIDKLPFEEAELVRRIVASAESTETMAFSSEDLELVNRALDRIQSKAH